MEALVAVLDAIIASLDPNTFIDIFLDVAIFPR
jgi:hypothetical protein